MNTIIRLSEIEKSIVLTEFSVRYWPVEEVFLGKFNGSYQETVAQIRIIRVCK
jgi:hypothetical protein